MSSTMDRGPSDEQAGASEAAVPTETQSSVRPSLKLWWPTLMLVAYWVVVEGGYRIELGMFPRFISRVIALLGLVLFFLVWGLTRRHFTLRQRLAALAMIVGAMVVAGVIGDASVNIFGAGMTGIPLVLTLSTAWLWFARSGSPRRELIGIGIVTVLVFGVISLLRWEGLDGRQRPQFAWRWTPTAEESFLDTLENSPNVSSSDAGAALPEIRVGKGDWASFRGGDRESVVTDTVLVDWKTSRPRERWRQRVGPGWGSVIAVGDVLITQEQRGGQESIVCYRTDDGSEVWSHSSESRFEEALSGTGPRATPSAAGGRVVAYGAKGRLDCLDLATGEPIWSRNVLEDAGAAVPMWGLSISPLIIDDLVVVFAGGQGDQGLLAFDLATGDPVWQAAAGTVTYSSP